MQHNMYSNQSIDPCNVHISIRYRNTPPTLCADVVLVGAHLEKSIKKTTKTSLALPLFFKQTNLGGRGG